MQDTSSACGNAGMRSGSRIRRPYLFRTEMNVFRNRYRARCSLCGRRPTSPRATTRSRTSTTAISSSDRSLSSPDQRAAVLLTGYVGAFRPRRPGRCSDAREHRPASCRHVEREEGVRRLPDLSPFSPRGGEGTTVRTRTQQVRRSGWWGVDGGAAWLDPSGTARPLGHVRWDRRRLTSSEVAVHG
jgi:hypothetical protein